MQRLQHRTRSHMARPRASGIGVRLSTHIVNIEKDPRHGPKPGQVVKGCGRDPLGGVPICF